ncbi:MAG TPA: aminotransferase class V-fold PLP-dependent enzyme [Solirubrobacteraceae bacterium]|nr:aminotransferase class V-fold PLP-dependent enzyme [Solirubrobacteraceae bacterium]
MKDVNRSNGPAPAAELDWAPERAAEFGAAALDVWTDWLGQLRDLPVARRETAPDVARALAMEVPEEPLPDDEILEHVRRLMVEHSVQVGHPGFMGYITGAGTVPGAAADLLAAAVNQNVGGYVVSPGATEIEVALTTWLARRFGLPEGAIGLLVTGGSIATFVALKVARDAACDWESRAAGVRDVPPLAIYRSTEAHLAADRGWDMLGEGTRLVRHVDVDDRYAMRLDALRRAVEHDRAAGIRPAAVIATAGTSAMGAIDPIADIATFCQREGIWLHVDAAYGGATRLSDDLSPLLDGVEGADSVTFDPHKWLYTPQSGGCVLVRDHALLERSFGADASFLRQDRELTGRGVDFGSLGPAVSRGFWALKVWVSLLAHGRRAYARRIEHDVELARYLWTRADERPEFEALFQSLSIACFRYVPEDLDDSPETREYVDRLNERLMHEMQLDGRVFVSNALLREGYALRACIVNYRTEAEDCDAVLDVAAELGARLDHEARAAAA